MWCAQSASHERPRIGKVRIHLYVIRPHPLLSLGRSGSWRIREPSLPSPGVAPSPGKLRKVAAGSDIARVGGESAWRNFRKRSGNSLAKPGTFKNVLKTASPCPERSKTFETRGRKVGTPRVRLVWPRIENPSERNSTYSGTCQPVVITQGGLGPRRSGPLGPGRWKQSEHPGARRFTHGRPGRCRDGREGDQ